MISNKKIALCALLWAGTHYAMENSMQQITTLDDLGKFAGRVVAYKTTLFDPTGYIAGSNKPKYLYIDKKPAVWATSSVSTIGYGTKKLLCPNDPIGNSWIITGEIHSSFEIRDITDYEKKDILYALKHKLAKVDYARYGTEDDQPVNIVLSLID